MPRRSVLRIVLILAVGSAVMFPVRLTCGPITPTDRADLPSGDPIEMSDAELELLTEASPAQLGSLSIGTVSNGVLLNAVPMPPGPNWDIINPKESWGTEETVRFITAAVAKVHEIHPGSPPLFIGDISRPEGGQLNRHATHQAGRDADLGFYYRDGWGWWHAPGNSRNLDIPRNWTLVRAMLTCTDLEGILLDIKIQRLLYRHALSIGEDEAWLKSVFQYPTGRRKTIIRHVRGHRTHYHVRFFNRRAQELARRAYPVLLRTERIKPPLSYASHKVRGGQTLGHLARLYRTSIRSIQRANRLRGTLIRAGRTYRIPCKGAPAPEAEPLRFPERKLPPSTPESLRGAFWPTSRPAFPPML